MIAALASAASWRHPSAAFGAPLPMASAAIFVSGLCQRPPMAAAFSAAAALAVGTGGRRQRHPARPAGDPLVLGGLPGCSAAAAAASAAALAPGGASAAAAAARQRQHRQRPWRQRQRSGSGLAAAAAAASAAALASAAASAAAVAAAAAAASAAAFGGGQRRQRQRYLSGVGSLGSGRSRGLIRRIELVLATDRYRCGQPYMTAERATIEHAASKLRVSFVFFMASRLSSF